MGSSYCKATGRSAKYYSTRTGIYGTSRVSPITCSADDGSKCQGTAGLINFNARETARGRATATRQRLVSRAGDLDPARTTSVEGAGLGDIALGGNGAFIRDGGLVENTVGQGECADDGERLGVGDGFSIATRADINVVECSCRRGDSDIGSIGIKDHRPRVVRKRGCAGDGESATDLEVTGARDELAAGEGEGAVDVDGATPPREGAVGLGVVGTANGEGKGSGLGGGAGVAGVDGEAGYGPVGGDGGVVVAVGVKDSDVRGAGHSRGVTASVVARSRVRGRPVIGIGTHVVAIAAYPVFGGGVRSRGQGEKEQKGKHAKECRSQLL